MKTDRFSDIIRRKLESIRPEFSEKDWTRMQQSLQTGVPQPGTPSPGQPFSGGIWTAKSWLMAAAAVSGVVLVAFSFWQQREINQLRQTIGQLNKPPTHQTAPEQSAPITNRTDTPALTRAEAKQPLANPEETPATKLAERNQRDTVYITRYVTVPEKSHVVPPEEERTVGRLEMTTKQRYATANRTAKSTAQPNQSDNLTNNPETNAYGESSTSLNATNKNADNLSVTSTSPANRPVRERRAKGEYVNNQSTKAQRTSSMKSSDQSGYTPDNFVGPTTASQAESTVASIDANQTATSASYELINSIPLSTRSVNWSSLLAQRAKRMRPARTTVVSGVEQAPESQPIAHISTQFRIGVGGEVASKLQGAGVYAELLLGKHWTISAGLSQATYTNKFKNDYDFDQHTRRDFRKEFARSIDPRREIFNIDTRTTRVQLPVAIGYRVPLTRTLTFTPSVGTYLNLTSTENATYFCPVLIPQRGLLDELEFTNNRPVDLINSLAFGTGLEWQRGHWVVQGSPVLNMPIQNDDLKPDPNWQKSTTVGIRARVLFQF